MTSTYVLIIIFALLFAAIIVFVVSNYVKPKKIEDIQKLIETGKTKLAIKKLNKLLEDDNRNPYVHFLLAEAYRIEGNHQFAIIEYRQVLKFGRFDKIIKEVNVRLALAKIFKEKKSLEEARNELLVLTKLDPTNYEVFFELGVLLFNAGHLDKAAGYFKNSSSLNAQHDQSFFYLGQIYYKNGLWADAKQYFLSTIQLDPQNYQAHYFLGLVLKQQGDIEWALKELEISIKNDDLKLKSLIARGMCYVEQSQFQKAAMEFERAIKFAKTGSDIELDIRYYLALCQEKTREIQSAIANWERIFEVNPRFRDVQHKLASYAELRQDDRIKDFVIAGLPQFELIARKIVAGMNLNIAKFEVISDIEIDILAVETEGKWRGSTRQSNKIIKINRTSDTLADSYFKIIYESMKQRNASTALIITTAEVSPKALEFTNTRPINIMGKNELIGILKKI
ncbi:MAG: tetratricopeptide repeat protein [Leptospirales bacterium]|nr:tetratricopeptide repeat protein [Leptospirales bacterium]